MTIAAADSFVNDGAAIPCSPAMLRSTSNAIEKLAATMWPGAPVIPTMATGASDSVFTNGAGMPSYGVSGIALETNDIRAHGKDERLPIDSFYRGVDFYYQLGKLITGGK